MPQHPGPSLRGCYGIDPPISLAYQVAENRAPNGYWVLTRPEDRYSFRIEKESRYFMDIIQILWKHFFSKTK